MKRHTKIVLGLVAGLGLASATAVTVSANSGHWGPGKDCGGPGGGRHAGVMRMFDRVDANGDGKVTGAELATFRSERFANADADGNGSISLEEFQTVWMEMTRPRMVDAFQRMDDDGDAAVTDEEFGGRLQRMQSWLDRDGDGAVSREELRGFGGRHGHRHHDDD